jgi:hypothetical protein
MSKFSALQTQRLRRRNTAAKPSASIHNEEGSGTPSTSTLKLPVLSFQLNVSMDPRNRRVAPAGTTKF